MANIKGSNQAYGANSPLVNVILEPIRSERNPVSGANSKDRYQIGQLWVNKAAASLDAFILAGYVNGNPQWINLGGGAAVFSSLTVDPGPTSLTGNVTVADLGLGVVQSSAAGLLSSSNGTNGQLLIGSTGVAPVWATLTAGGGITIVEGAGSITISNPGATGTTFATDVGGPVSPDGAGQTSFIGGASGNLSSDGSVANTVSFDIVNNPTFSGLITGQNGLTISAGTTSITSNSNAGQDIYLHANGGVNETIDIHADQGTGANSIDIHSDGGGVRMRSGLAAANALRLHASNAAGGLDLDVGTGGISMIANNGAVNIESGTAAANFGADAVAHATTVGSTTGAASLTLQGGTGGWTATSTDVMDLDAVAALSINSSAGVINVGNDAVAQNINVGTGAAARTITIGNATGASSVVINAGTGNVDLGANATDHSTTLGSTNGVSATTVQAGTGALNINGGGAVNVDAVGALALNSSGAAINIGNDADAQAINIGTGAAARTITIGNGTGATSVVLDSGTGNLDLGVNATDHTSRLGSTNGTSATTIQAGTGAMTFTAGGAFDVNAAGNVTIDSSGGTLNLGADADAQAINIGTGAAARTITMGNGTGATSVVLEAGTGDVNIGVNAVAHSTNVGTTTGAADTVIQAGTGGISLSASGIVTMAAATDTDTGPGATASVTINANVGSATLDSFVTAAAATLVVTVNNSICTVNSVLFVTATNKGANDAQMTVTRVEPKAGSFDVTLTNNGAAALNGDIILNFWLIVA